MAQQIVVDIVIDGQKIAPFSNLMLRQQINQHHYFEIRFNYDVVEDKDTFNINKSQAMLGKKVTITFKTVEPSGESIFKGILTDIRFANHLDSPGDLIFCGYSPTILLETGEGNSSYLDKTLDQIAKAVTGSVPSNELSIGVQPKKTTQLPYIVQYRESHFSFLRRLAAEYGEQFYYDGQKLNFGKPGSGGDSFVLTYPNEVQDINLQLKIGAVNFEQSGYLPKDDNKLKSPSSRAQVAGLDGFGASVMDVSKSLYTDPLRSLSPRAHHEAAEVDQSVQMDLSQRAASFVMLNAVAVAPLVSVGDSVQFRAGNVDYGSFSIVAITHQADGIGNYHNDIEAIPSQLEVFPNPYHRKMIAEPQLAEVTDTTDPDKQGRVKVKLLWQKDSETTPFIRVMTPHGGTYSSGKKTRGFYFTPEVGEHIVVGFQENDPERPFVMGSLPHGKAIDSADNRDTFTKSLSTRSGNIITFTDKENDGEQEIKIQTDPNNYISINLKNSDGTIKIYSSKAMELKAKETILIESETSIDIKSKTINIEASDTLTAKANTKAEIKSAAVSIEGSNTFEAKGGSSAKISSAQTEISGSGTAKVTAGGQLSLEASGQAALKGAIVMIN